MNFWSVFCYLSAILAVFMCVCTDQADAIPKKKKYHPSSSSSSSSKGFATKKNIKYALKYKVPRLGKYKYSSSSSSHGK
jgi:hypothetical protein